MKKKWYCYICGEKLLKNYVLCSVRESTDRVFLCCKKTICIEQINTEDTIIKEIVENE